MHFVVVSERKSKRKSPRQNRIGRSYEGNIQEQKEALRVENSKKVEMASVSGEGGGK